MGKRKISNPSRILSLLLTMLIFVSAGDFASRLWASQSQDISVSVRLDAVPPTNITDLVASPDNTEDGKIDLVWTTPGDDGSVGELPDYPYKVKYDTRSVAELGGTTTSWWEQAQWEYPAGGWSALNPGETDDTKWLAGLIPGTTYWIAIKAKDKVGNPAIDANVASCKAGDKVPEAPKGLTALAGDEKISLSWSANTEVDIAGYNIYYDTDSSGPPYTHSIWVGNVTSYQLTNLTNFTTYYIAITAFDNAGNESGCSKEVSGYPWILPPAAPTDFEGVVLSTVSVRWSWTDNADNEDGYKVKDQMSDIRYQMPANTTYWLETGLSPNTSYYRYVEAYNDAGASCSTPSTKYTFANPPVELVSLSQTASSLSLSWNANNNSSITRYEISQSTDNFVTNFSTPVALSANLTATTTTVYNLNEGARYYFRVRTANGDNILTDFTAILATSTALVSPAAITDLTAEPAEEEGQIRLSWTAPGDDKYSGQIADGRWRIAYSTIADCGLTIDDYKIGISTTCEPLSTHSWTVTGLKPSSTYYFRIWTCDEVPNWSGRSNIASATAGDRAPAKPKNLTALLTQVARQLRVVLSWSDLTPEEKGLDFDYYRVYRATSEGNYAVIGTTSAISYIDVINITASSAQAYYYYVTAVDKPPVVLQSEPSALVEVYCDLPPRAPVGLIAVGSDREIHLRWEGNIEADLAGYNLYRSTYSLGYSTIPINALLMSTTFYKDTELTNGVLYYYVVTALDINGNESSYSAEVVCMPRDSIPPREPAGIKGILSSNRRRITICWSKVCQNVDGSSCTDLAGYNIYSAPDIEGEYKLRAFIPSPNQSHLGSGQANGDLGWVEPNDASEQVFYYLVKAVDTSKNESKSSMIVDSSREQNIYATDEKDRWCHVSIPGEINQVLYKGNNRYGDDVKIEVVRNEKEEIGRIGKCYTFVAKEGTTDEPIKDFAFAKPEAQIILRYGSLEKFASSGQALNQGKLGPGQAPSPEEWAAKNLALFWFNGLEWVKLGGDVDPYHRIISIRSKRLGKYMIAQSRRASAFGIDSIPSGRVITPNEDGWNDYFEVICANPYTGNVSGKIYDLRGAFVAGMEKSGFISTGSVSLKWDGKDEDGNAVPGGVYIYQIEITGPESKVVNGTVVLAK